MTILVSIDDEGMRRYNSRLADGKTHVLEIVWDDVIGSRRDVVETFRRWPPYWSAVSANARAGFDPA